MDLYPLFQEKIAYGTRGFPWNSNICKRKISYKKGICPNAEKLHDKNFISIGISEYDYKVNDVKIIIKTFNKVWKNLKKL